jgi:hypothetical protein
MQLRWVVLLLLLEARLFVKTVRAGSTRIIFSGYASLTYGQDFF